MESPRKARIPAIKRSLSVILASIQGSPVIVELKNDTEVAGIIDEIDPSMAMVLSNAKQTSSSGIVQVMESIHINGPSIRYIHFPKDVNIVNKINNYEKTLEKIHFNPANYKNRPKRKHSELETDSKE